VVLAADDQVKAVVVGVIDQRAGGMIALDDLVLDCDSGSVSAIADLGEALLQVTAGGLR
jgi:hypothetical protein